MSLPARALGRCLAPAFIVSFVLALVLFAWPAAAATAVEDCLDLVKLTVEELSEDPSLLARLREQLDQAEELCRAGKTQEAEALLREMIGRWMPMGPGN